MCLTILSTIGNNARSAKARGTVSAHVTFSIDEKQWLSAFVPFIHSISQRKAIELLVDRVRDAVQTHLLFLDTLPNKNNWPKTHFYAKAANSVSSAILSDDEGVVRISYPGFAQRYYGGPILPVNAEVLTIPVSPLSYGKKPSDFKGLFAKTILESAPNTVGGLFLPTRVAGSRNRKGKTSLVLLFALSKGVVQSADPGVLPKTDILRDALVAAMVDFINNGPS